ncbi:UDP-2,4-diacetamido-2,4,6-trideoxy-beta-L-altropyranose hydrolase [Paraburkholderia bengalensis]|uniref:UDP-2,4-diacetamido-2,4, 6-trideoxy-beta-L-altropyranose hydrolase n=1 Tax=Paraburkholderia bengalensis TaxID=2747562 RepID=A0ABU8J4E4_9BURK
MLFRADSGVAIGSGHLVRSMALAREFAAQGAQVAFVCRERSGALLDLPREAGYALHVLNEDTARSQEDDAHETQRFAQRWEADLAVVDHYALDARWESIVRGSTGALLAIDDLADRPHAGDWLLDQNDCAPRAQRYARWVSADCALLLGPRFALVHPEFRAARARVAPRDGTLHRIVLFFSGSDDTNETAKALQGLAMLDTRPLHIDVVIGATHPDARGIDETCSHHGWHFHQQIGYMADLLAAADLCVGSAGSSSWERCILGAPAIVVQLADNQREVIHALTQQGCARSLGDARDVRPADYASAIAALNAADLAAMSRAGMEWIDGQGAARVVCAVAQRIAE